MFGSGVERGSTHVHRCGDAFYRGDDRAHRSLDHRYCCRLSTLLFIRQCFYLRRRPIANLGRGILLGLEFLVAADIIGTVAVTPESLGVLIIVIRTMLSFALQVEIEGQLPWQRRQASSVSAREPSANQVPTA